MSGPRALKLALAAACVVPLASCSHTQSVGADRTLRIGLSEYRLNPSSVRTSAGNLTIYVHNYGRLKHDLVVTHNGQTAAFVQPLAPGQSAQVTVNLAPGAYSMASTVLSDDALGAYGTLTVER
jgi:hypothetical protein